MGRNGAEYGRSMLSVKGRAMPAKPLGFSLLSLLSWVVDVAGKSANMVADMSQLLAPVLIFSD